MRFGLYGPGVKMLGSASGVWASIEVQAPEFKVQNFVYTGFRDWDNS